MIYDKISGFSDEIANDIATQFEVLNKLGIEYFEPRGIDGKNISELTDAEAYDLKEKMSQYNIKASSIGSPIGKIKITDDFEPHFTLFKRVVEIAKILDTKYIRMFSFYGDGAWTDELENEVFSRLSRMIEYAGQNGVVLLHENEKHIYGDVTERCVKLMEKLYCDSFRAVFDPANFIQCGVDTKEAYKELKEYITYMHIKDAISESGRVVPSGMGDGNVEYILNDLFKCGYNGFLSLEPHLGSFDGLADLELDDAMLELPKSGEGTFTIAYNALNKILNNIKEAK